MIRKFSYLIFSFLLSSAVLFADKEPDVTSIPVITIDNQSFHLAFTDESKILRIWEFLPEGESLDRWQTLAGVMQYQFAIPTEDLLNSMSLVVEKQEGRIIGKKFETPDTAVLAFVVHDPENTFTEINIFRYFQRNGLTIAHQYAHRFYGDEHVDHAKQAVKQNMGRWVQSMKAADYPSLLTLVQLED